jgi:CheY-like chemotaxis protein
MIKILVIGRRGTVRNEHVERLEREGYLVLTADTKPDGLDRVEQACPDLVVLEAGLPGIADHVVLARLTERIPRIPVLFVTAMVDERACDAADAFVCERPREGGETLGHAVRTLINVHAV